MLPIPLSDTLGSPGNVSTATKFLSVCTQCANCITVVVISDTDCGFFGWGFLLSPFGNVCIQNRNSFS